METTTKIVVLWSHVHSISTAFERAFIQRKDYITFHEPFGEPAYYGPERIYSYYDNELNEHAEYINTTYAQMIDEILKATEQKNVFIKDMARHVIRPDYQSHPDNPTVLPIDFLKRCKHTFILRKPEKSIPALYNQYITSKKEFIHDDIGYLELQVLFEFLTEMTGVRPTLIEADDLLHEPKMIMQIYCESAIGDRFEPSMLEWKSERIQAFDKWPNSHEQAQYSTGFNQIHKPKDKIDKLVLPHDVQQLIERSIPIYNTLYQFRTHV